jgi:hypothetical protein
MRTTLVSLLCLVPCLVAVAQQPKAESKEFVSKDGGFSVVLPETPKESTEDGLKQHQFQVDTPNGTLVVSYQDNPGLKDATDDVIVDALKQAQEAVQKGFQGNPVKSQAIKLADKYPGLDFECDIPAAGGVYRSRSYMVDGRLYQLIAVGVKEFATGETANTFLGSLKLLPK